jgi:alpha-glucosidase
MWNDLELYHDYRDFTVDPVKFSANEMRDFIRNLVSPISSFLIIDARDAE